MISSTYWMPFTANRSFSKNPKMIHSAYGMYYYTAAGTKILDGISGLWCVNLGHGRPEIVDAVSKQMSKLDYATAFQVSHNSVHSLSDRLINLLGSNEYTNKLKHVFFTNSGSEAVDTSLKIALAYHKAKNSPDKIILVGREKGYHGVCFGGMSVGGLENNKKQFRPALSNVDHLPHLLDIEKNAYSKGFHNMA